jgi:hypothetical protein
MGKLQRKILTDSSLCLEETQNPLENLWDLACAKILATARSCSNCALLVQFLRFLHQSRLRFAPRRPEAQRSSCEECAKSNDTGIKMTPAEEERSENVLWWRDIKGRRNGRTSYTTKHLIKWLPRL